MKIIFLTRLFYPHTGGVEKHIYELSKILKKDGHEIIVVTEKHKKSLKSYEEFESLKIYRIPIPRSEKMKKFSIWKWMISNRNLIINSDIIHAHDVFYWLLPVRFLYPSKKVYTTFHGYEGNNIPGFKEKLMHRLAERLSKSTLSIGNFYTKWYGTKSAKVSYGAVSKSTTKLKSRKKIIKIAYLGRLEEEAGIVEYIEGVRMLSKKNIHLEVLGDGSLRHNLEKKASNNKLPVKFYGWVESPEEKIKSADIVFTSRYLGILESLAMEKYVIAVYNNKIKKDYLKMTPFAKYISIVTSPLEISQKVEEYIKHPAGFNNIINKGYNWAKKQTWEKLTREYYSLWN